MWIPTTEEDILVACQNKGLEETVTFDAKRQIPDRNIETAKDISALANTSGGVLVYGLGEDEYGRPTVPTPLALKGAREKIDQIIRTSVDEVPAITISTIPTKDDVTKGYLVVVVPPSDRAPHMVIVKDERRYYGRSETGNYVLNQTEIARLYERRKHTDTSILPPLEQFVTRSPLKSNDDFAHLHILARPVLFDERIFIKALSPGQEHAELLDTLVENAASQHVFRENPIPRFVRPPHGWTRRPEGYLGKLSAANDVAHPDKDTLNLEVNFNGWLNLLCGRAGALDTTLNYPMKWFHSSLVASHTTRLLVLLGDLYSRAGYLGMVEIGIAVIGLYNCASRKAGPFFDSYPRYQDSEYWKTLRISAVTISGNEKNIAAEMLMPLVDAISQGTDDPFAK